MRGFPLSIRMRRGRCSRSIGLRHAAELLFLIRSVGLLCMHVCGDSLFSEHFSSVLCCNCQVRPVAHAGRACLGTANNHMLASFFYAGLVFCCALPLGQIVCLLFLLVTVLAVAYCLFSTQSEPR